MLGARRLVLWTNSSARCASANAAFMSSMRKYTTGNSNLAFVFDIDGVLIRGEKAIVGAGPTLKLLNDHKVPFILLTNGGGVSEKERVQFISETVQVPISPLQIVQSHTPMKALAHKHAYDRVLVVGGPGDKARHCALGYGFHDVIMPIDIVRANPAVSPHHRYTAEDFDRYSREVDLKKPIEAILVFNDPRDMTTDVQIVSDLLNSDHGVIGTKRSITKLKHREDPSVPIIFSNNDFLWANDYPLPRFGQGAFRIMVENLYREINQLKDGQHLHSIIMGKPFKIQYDFAHHVLIDWRSKLLSNDTSSHSQFLPSLGSEPRNSPFKRIFMVGDNPASDIKGANDNGWESILVRTGVYDNEDLSTIIAQPTVGVFDDVYTSVEAVLKSEKIL